MPKLRAKKQTYLLIDKIVENGIKLLTKALLRLTAVWRKVSIFDYSFSFQYCIYIYIYIYILLLPKSRYKNPFCLFNSSNIVSISVK